MCLLHHIAGAFTEQPEALKDRLGPKAGDLIKRAFDDIDPARLVDRAQRSRRAKLTFGCPNLPLDSQGELSVFCSPDCLGRSWVQWLNRGQT